MPGNSVRVFVVAPALLAWGLERLIRTRAPEFILVGVAPDFRQARPLLERDGADVVLFDVDCDSTLDGMREGPAHDSARFIVLAAAIEARSLDRIVFAGVRGVVRKSDTPQHLLEAIEKVHAGELWIDRSITDRCFMELARRKAPPAGDPDGIRIATLTPRERETISALASNVALPGKVIARRLCISEHTLRNHLSSIYSKLGLSNRLDLYAYATRHHLGEGE